MGFLLHFIPSSSFIRICSCQKIEEQGLALAALSKKLEEASVIFEEQKLLLASIIRTENVISFAVLRIQILIKHLQERDMARQKAKKYKVEPQTLKTRRFTERASENRNCSSVRKMQT
jgi:hypothetical protein